MSDHELAELKGESHERNHRDDKPRNDQRKAPADQSRKGDPLFEFFNRNLKSNYYRELLPKAGSIDKDAK